MNMDNVSSLVSQIAKRLVQAQTDDVQSKLRESRVRFSKSLSLDVNTRLDDSRQVATINAGTIQFLSSLCHILMNSIAGPETNGRPLSTGYDCYKSAIQLSLKYLNPHDGELQIFVRVPRTHPYLNAIGVLLDAQTAFLIAHEYSHHLLGHLTRPINVLGYWGGNLDVEAEDAHRMYDQEREADGLGTELFFRYLKQNATSPLDHIGIAGPNILLQWLRFCETLYYSLFIHNQKPNPRSFSRKREERTVTYSSLHGHPIGRERATEYHSKAARETIPQFADDLCVQCERLVDYFLWISQDEERHNRMYAGEDPE